MKTTKRLSAFLVSLVMLFSLLSISVSAWSAGEGIDVYWNGEKAGTVSYEEMDKEAQGFDAETYSNNKDVYTGKFYKFSKLLRTAGVNDAYKAAADDTKVVITDAGKTPKPAEFTKSELEEKRNSYKKDGSVFKEDVSPGFMHIDGEDYFRFVFGQKTPDDNTSGRWTKLQGTGNAKIEITTPATPEPEPEPEPEPVQKDGIEVIWNDESVGTITYDQMVDDVSQASKTVTYSAVNSEKTYSTYTAKMYPFTQLLENVNKDKDWESASKDTVVVFDDGEYVTNLTKSAITEERYFFDKDGTLVEKVKPGFIYTESKKGNYMQFAIGQTDKDEQNNGYFFKLKKPATISFTTPDLEIVAPDGVTKGLSFSDLDALWKEEGEKKYNYTNSNTYPTFKTDEYWGPTLKAVLAKAGIDLDALADTDVIRFDSSDGKGADITVKDIKATRYTFPNGKSDEKNYYKGTTAAQLEGKSEVPFILSITNGKLNIRNVFGQIDPQEEQTSYFIKYINKITVKKDAAKEFTGLTPTIADGSKVKKGDKLNFDLTLPTGVYEGAIYYTVSTDGKEPADPTYSDIFYNWSQNRTDDKDYLDPAKAQYYNIYEFTDAPVTIVKVKVYVSGYAEPKAMTLTYTQDNFTGLADEADKDGNWWYYTNGEIDKTHTGVDENKNGWWRVEDGKVNFNAQGIYKNDYGWWKTTDGKVTFKETGVFKNDYGWWRVEDSKVNFKAQGIYKNDYGWWKTTDGKVTFDETGVFKNDYGWWRVEKSKVNFKANGIYKNQYGWWKTTDGKVTFKETGVFKNEYGWWRVEDSKVNFKANGLYKNEYGTWYVKNGKVDFNYNGTYQGKTIKGGKVQ